MLEGEKKLFKNIYYLSLVQVVNYLLPLVTLPLLVKSLTIVDFAKIVLMYSISSLALIVNEYGFNVTGPYFVAKNINNSNKLNEFLSNVFFVKTIISFFSFIIFFTLCYFFEVMRFTEFEQLILSLLIIVQAFQFSWFFQGIERMSNITKAVLSSKFLYFSLILILIEKNDPALKVMIIFLISQILLAFVYMYRLRKEKIILSYKEINLNYSCNILIENFSYFLSRIAVIGYTMLNSIIVSANDSMKSVALYGLSEKIYQLILSFLSPVTQALYPYMIRNKRYKIYFIFLVFGFIALSILCFVLNLVAENIILYMFGNEYLTISNILSYFYILILIVFLSINIGHPLLGSIGKLKEVNYSVYAGFVVFMALMLARSYSLDNLLVNLILTECCVLIIRFYFVIRSFIGKEFV